MFEECIKVKNKWSKVDSVGDYAEALTLRLDLI